MIAVAAHTDASLRETLTSVLTSIGWTVHATEDPDDAVEACRRTEADVLFVGGEVDGEALGLLDRVKRDAELFRTAVVLVSGDVDPQDVVDWLSRGADDVLHVPLSAADVVGRASAPPLDPTEQDLAWFFKLFSLRGLSDGVEQACFFTYLQKSDDSGW